jgi:glycosyltransferase involved in cell wall biosynthesis
MSKIPVSAVLIVKNAARELPACLASVSFCAEMLVVDSGSTDATVAIAEAAGARVIRSHWRGFGAQKQFAVEQAAYDWVLCIDADERVSDRLRQSLCAVFAVPQGDFPETDSKLRGVPKGDWLRGVSPAPSFSAYRCARRNRFMGRYLRHGEGYPDWVVRCFDRRHARWSDDVVHEKVMVAGDETNVVGILAGDLLHDSAESLENYLAKQNRYSTLAAEAAIARGKRAHVGNMLLSPWVRFIKFYFLRLGLLDGLPGLVHILIGCGASFAKYIKMVDRQSRSSSDEAEKNK